MQTLSRNRRSICEALEPRQLYSITAYPTDGGTSVQTQRSEARELIVTLDTSDTLTAADLTLKLANGDGSGANDGSASTDISSTVLGTPTHISGDEWAVPIVASTTYSDATGSLKDGIYNLTVTDGSDTATVGFWRLMGDLNGDGFVNSADTYIYDRVLGGTDPYSAACDFNLDGYVNSADSYQYSHHALGDSFVFPSMTSATASTYTVTGTTVNLTANGGASSSYGSGTLVYHWQLISGPSGTTAPTYSANGTNASSSTTATLYGAGNYVFGASIADPATANIPNPQNTITGGVTVDQTLATLALFSSTTTVGASGTLTATVTGNDQFNDTYSGMGGITLTYSEPNNDGLPGNTNVTVTMPSLAGYYDLIASGGGTTSNTVGVTVEPPAFTSTGLSATVNDSTIGSTPTVTLSATGTDPDGEYTLVYAMSIEPQAGYGIGGAYCESGIWPSGVGSSTPFATFSGTEYTNGEKSCVAHMNSCGHFTFTCLVEDDGGNQFVTDIDVYVPQKLTTLFIPATNVCYDAATVSMFISSGPYATCQDQFGMAMATAPTLSWSIPVGSSGSTINVSTGSYTATSYGDDTDEIEVDATSGYSTGLYADCYMHHI